MRIILDQDQVICDWVGRILEWYNEDKGTSLTLNDVKTWNMCTNLGPNSEDFIRSCMRYPELYRDLYPIEGAIPGVKKLIDAGHDVIIATAVPKCAGIAYHGKLEWIRRNMPFFDLNNFVAIHRKYLIDADILFDDAVHNVEPFVTYDSNKKKRYAVLLDNPWNEYYVITNDLEDALFRVHHWNEFLKLVDEIQMLKDGI